ncbi:hypothetical protein ACFFX0_19705 [Citricoccus parietis]|uniref:Transposase IS200-like domain-containing protein n=1 Tax=Citricoccus parietis TaxID=592307 RepID=A0ABV5G2Z2_9MICC
MKGIGGGRPHLQALVAEDGGHRRNQWHRPDPAHLAAVTEPDGQLDVLARFIARQPMVADRRQHRHVPAIAREAPLSLQLRHDAQGRFRVDER